MTKEHFEFKMKIIRLEKELLSSQINHAIRSKFITEGEFNNLFKEKLQLESKEQELVNLYQEQSLIDE